MAVYEYGRIRKLAEELGRAGVDQQKIEAIMEGGELIKKADKPVKKSDWMKHAMDKMDSLLDFELKRSVRESCACCLGGKRNDICKQIAKSTDSLDDALIACNEARYVFGYSVTTEPDGRILVRFEPEGKESYRCVCLPKAKEPISATYCYCCGGHIKHHLQTALKKNLECEVRSTALSSGGKSPCSFLYTILE